jgi:hypothetical protein
MTVDVDVLITTRVLKHGQILGYTTLPHKLLLCRHFRKGRGTS